MHKSLLAVILLLFLSLPTFAWAGHSHYVNGLEGLKVSSMPVSEGLYLKTYAAFYYADKMTDDSGHKSGMQVRSYMLVNRFLYSSEIEFLGGNLLFSAAVPVVYNDIRVKRYGLEDDHFNLSDIMLQPLLVAWHGQHWDALVGASVYLPSGYYSKNHMASVGKGFTSFMFNAGGTLYFDAAKSWHASMLARYEVHTRQSGTHIRPADDFGFEWGVGKTFSQMFDVGIAGYCTWQLANDHGKQASNVRERAYAVGPEIGFAIPAWQAQVSLRSLWEFANRNATQGNISTLTMMFSF